MGRIRTRRGIVGVLVALLVGVLAVGPANAYSIVNESGSVGEYSLNDTAESPAAVCRYGDVVHSNWAWIKSVKVKPPVVRAADRNSDKRDRRRVSWQFRIQHSNYPELASWTVVKSSPVQHGLAFEDQAADFTPLSLAYSPPFSEQEGQSGVFRTLVIIKWYRRSGSVEGTARLLPTYYRTKSLYGTFTRTEMCSTVTTDG